MKEMTELHSLDSIENFIKQHKFSFIFISRPGCTVCHAVLPQLRIVLDQFPNIKLGHINADDVAEVAGHFQFSPFLCFFCSLKRSPFCSF